MFVKTVCILQARLSSTRLPGKVLMKVTERPLLEIQIKRVLKSSFIDRLILATSVGSDDDLIEELGKSLGVEVFRGSLDDVLDRFYQSVRDIDSENIVRLTGDCPIIDPSVIDLVIERHLNSDADYTTNSLNPTYPDGMDVEVFKKEALEESWKNASKKSEREHVTLYINSRPEKFKIQHVKNTDDLSHLRWTVDEQEDFNLVKMIIENFKNLDFTLQDSLNFVRDNNLEDYNTKYKRNEGLEKSIREDA
ncbi:MAG: spore coat protein [Halobacteriovoraceae bacterium]|nr:spore coat protein [Halobacteriovoraceae bacterium]